MTKKNFKDALRSSDHPLILDGAIGSLLQQRGYESDQYLWTSYINFKFPEVLKQIHLEYINSGCDIITSNTFRTNPFVLQASGLDLDVEEAVRISMSISHEIASSKNVWLAGSNPPAEDCYQSERTISQSELEYNHKKHIELLYNYKADFILNETQSHYDEINIICKFCDDNDIPYCISLFFDENLRILSGESINEMIDFIKSYNPIAILVNCINHSSFLRFLDQIELSYPWGFYLNCGSGNINDSVIKCGMDILEYQNIIRETIKYNPKIIGTCCGSNPAHIKSIAELVNE